MKKEVYIASDDAVVIGHLKFRKVAGEDEIRPEMLKALNSKQIFLANFSVGHSMSSNKFSKIFVTILSDFAQLWVKMIKKHMQKFSLDLFLFKNYISGFGTPCVSHIFSCRYQLCLKHHIFPGLIRFKSSYNKSKIIA